MKKVAIYARVSLDESDKESRQFRPNMKDNEIRMLEKNVQSVVKYYTKGEMK
jgi:hypothetical protein